MQHLVCSHTNTHTQSDKQTLIQLPSLSWLPLPVKLHFHLCPADAAGEKSPHAKCTVMMIPYIPQFVFQILLLITLFLRCQSSDKWMQCREVEHIRHDWSVRHQSVHFSRLMWHWHLLCAGYKGSQWIASLAKVGEGAQWEYTIFHSNDLLHNIS